MDKTAPHRAVRPRPAGLHLGPTALVALLAAFALAVPAGPASPAATAQDKPRTAMASDTYEATIERLINRRRAAHGLRPLHSERCADENAERWAASLADTGTLLHQGSGAITAACAVTYAGETLGRGGFGPHKLVKIWMRSPLHRPVVMSPLARRIGVGSYRDQHGRWVTSASFTRP